MTAKHDPSTQNNIKEYIEVAVWDTVESESRYMIIESAQAQLRNTVTGVTRASVNSNTEVRARILSELKNLLAGPFV